MTTEEKRIMRFSGIKSLACLKMEKNFIAIQEKGYPSKPYTAFSLAFLIDRIEEELRELRLAYREASLVGVREELADLSNLIDYCYEKILAVEFGIDKKGGV